MTPSAERMRGLERPCDPERRLAGVLHLGGAGDGALSRDAAPAGRAAIAFDPVSWHVPEMRCGYLGVVMVGFLLTAVANWTGSLPIRGWPLPGLALLWGLGFEGICNTLDVSPSNVQVLLHRARTKPFSLVDPFRETGANTEVQRG